MKKSVELAIIGSGAIARIHVEAINRVAGARISAVYSQNADMAQSLAADCGANVFLSLEELLAASEIDAVLIATPSGTHEEIAVSCLRSGKHVLCEKPLEITTARVRRMVEEAKHNGAILAGFFPLRCGFGAKAIRRALDDNRFGRLTFLSARVKWWRDQDYYQSSKWRGTFELDGGGALMNQGIHAVDLIQWMGGAVKDVTAFSATLAHPGLKVEDSLTACLRFESGALGTIEAGTSSYPGLALSIEISGDRGTAILVDDQIESWNFSEEIAEDVLIRAGGKDDQIQGGASDPRAITCEGHRQQISEFCSAIRGESNSIIDGSEAGKSVAIVETIYRSALSGKAEAVVQL